MAVSNIENMWLDVQALWRHPLWRRRLLNKSVSIISNDCWGGFLYRYLHLPFNSPFIGLFVMPEDFVKILEDPSMLEGELTFISKAESRHLQHIHHTADYPVGLLPSGVEIHFLHYPSAEVARSKWNRRVKRIDWNNAIIKLSDNYYITDETMRRFDALPYPQKVLFTGKPHPELECACYLPEFRKDGRTAERIHKVFHRHWDFIAHANALTHNTDRQ